MPTSPHDPEAGLSLVETLLVLAILAMASGLVFGRGLPGTDRLERARLAGFLSEARAAAMLAGDPVTVRAEGGQLLAIRAGVVIARYDPVGTPGLAAPVRFRADGTSAGGAVVLSGKDDPLRADIAAPTGRITLAP